MNERITKICAIGVGVAFQISVNSPAFSADNTPASAADRQAAIQNAQAENDQLLAELTSGDNGRVRNAIDQVHERALRNPSRRASTMLPLVDARLFAEAEAMAQAFIRSDPSTSTIGRVQWFRVQLLMAQQRWPEALSAARSYYECCELNDTPDAVGLIALCLQKSCPRDPDVAQRFEQQQITSANSDIAATQPAAVSLGQPILATIAIDTVTFSDAADAIELNDFRSYVRKANLMLVCGRPAVAHELLEKAAALAARQSEIVEALAGQARAIRAEQGCLGPANAFIASLQLQK